MSKAYRPDQNPEYVEESKQFLRDQLLKRRPHTILMWVNRAGDNRAVKILVGTDANTVRDLSIHVARVTQSRVIHGGVEVHGGNMNPSVQILDYLYRQLDLNPQDMPNHYELTGI